MSEWSIGKIKKLAEECLAHHGPDAFCEDWGCKIVLQVVVELEQSKAEIKELEKRIDDWRGLCSIEQTTGMGWKERALKAEAEVKRLKALLSQQGIPF